MFHVHKWTDWLITERGRVVDRYLTINPPILGTYLLQERYCATCGKTQLKSQKTTMRDDVRYVPETKKVIPKHDKVT